MKKLLIMSFDLVRAGESEKSLAISSILTYLKQDQGYGNTFSATHLSINMLGLGKGTTIADLKGTIEQCPIHDFDYIALSAYIWNEYLTNDLMTLMRSELGFRGAFILGGYQISYSNQPELEYPEADYFISGYAEQALLDIITGKTVASRARTTVDFNAVPSPYLSGELPLEQQQKMVRLETKRGCPYRCTFCAHRDLTFNKVHKHSLEKVYRELALFKELQVGKINIIDPIYNAGKDYLAVMEEMIRLNISSRISVQARFETIKGKRGEQFLEQCQQLNFNLEFGLQTAIFSESETINRKNDPKEIKRVMQALNKRGIDYEISLIYGLPHQTLDSFKQSIDFVMDNGCYNLTAFPLMLLKGTELYQQKDQFGFQEQAVGAYHIPVVTKSNSFSETDWTAMRHLAATLEENARV